MSARHIEPSKESIAVIGMRGRFPGAESVEELWENLKNGVETISTFGEAELRSAGIDPAYLNVPGFVNRGSIITGVEMFDAGFFGYSARDAETIDPQHRVFMELSWESLEEAGYDSETYPGSIGVYVGSDQSSYLYQIYQHIDVSALGYAGMMSIGNEKDYVATQVSYKLNLRGPSMAIQTSCSTSLVAVTMACQSLLFGTCDIALAGGVAISFPQRAGYWYQMGGILSPDGHCRPFDAAGQGTVVGSAVGIVVLKRLSEALADGDRIHAVIRGFGLNNDGSSKVGYTAPSIDGQAAAIRMAHRMVGVEPDSIGYVETHGTATALGDPVEIAALTKAFRERTTARQFCAIGSLKSNTGHLSSAAGVAGLIKGILTVQHGKIPKNLHYESPNPHIDFKNSPFFVAADYIDWPVKTGPRRAGVSSFGVGGTNAHLVLEELPDVERDDYAPEKQLLVLSARTVAALEKTTDNLIERVSADPSLDLADVAYTLQIGRRVFPHRRTLLFDRSDREGLLAALRTRDPQKVSGAHTEMRDRAVVFMFSGQGTQYVGMARDLYDSEPGFRDDVDTCAEILRGEMNADIRDFLYPESADQVTAQERLTRTSITQPALFTIEYALARLWMEWGVTPRAMIGHSVGEYVAACLAGVMDVQQALSVVAMRGRLMESMPAGSMLAVSLSEAALRPLLGPQVSLAAVNAPSLCVLSGTTEAIEPLDRQFTDQGLMCRRLQTSHAFHSGMMDPIIRQFVERMSRVRLQAPKIAYLSNVTGSWITPELATSPQYWGTHLRQTVRFADNLREAMVFPDLALLEIGPGQTLGFLARQQGGRANSQLIVASLRSAHEQVPDPEQMLTTLGKLWLGGVRVDWAGVHAHEARRRVPLPTYPFERQRFWLGPVVDFAQPPGDPLSLAAVAQPAVVAAPPPVAAAPRDIGEWLYAPSWRPATVRRNAGDAAAAGPWLVFTDSAGVGEEVVRRLRDAGATVTSVTCGDSFSAGEESFAIRPAEKGDYEELLKSLRTAERSPARILHLWSIDEPPAGVPEHEAFDDVQRRGFYSVVALAQAIGKAAGASQWHVGIVTDRLQPVTGDEELRSLEGPILGACKVVPQEYPNIRCRSIDVNRTQANPAESLIAEMDGEAFAPVVAYRNGRRWIEELEPVQLEKPAAPPELLRDEGVYLITGGLGNIGLTFADAISKQVKARLVLTGRSPFPNRADWDAHIQAAPGDAVSARIRAIRAIEQRGSEVMIAQADATRPEEMERLVAAVEETWSAIDGVIHAAANLSNDGFTQVRDIDAAKGELHFAPKSKGLLTIENLLREHPPRFYVLLSSLSAVLGGLNLCAYAASNAFLDAEARRRNQTGPTSWITTNWDGWDFAGGQKDLISAAGGQDAFLRILASPLRHVVVSVTPLAPRLEKWVTMKRDEKPAAAPSATAVTAGATHTRPELSTQYLAPRTETETTIVGVWEQLLGVAPIGIYDKFFELGGHSLLAIQLLARLREIFDLDLPVQRIFEAPTVAQLSESIDRDRGQNAATAAAGGDGENAELQEMLRLVEGLSEAELDALLNEAQSMEKGQQAHE